MFIVCKNVIFVKSNQLTSRAWTMSNNDDDDDNDDEVKLTHHQRQSREIIFYIQATGRTLVFSLASCIINNKCSTNMASFSLCFFVAFPISIPVSLSLNPESTAFDLWCICQKQKKNGINENRRMRKAV